MKKIFCIFCVLFVSLTITACKNEVISAETLEFENTHWGMGKAETLKALHLKESDLVIVESTIENKDYIVYSKGDFSYLGYKCKLNISFATEKTALVKADTLVAVELLFYNKEPALKLKDKCIKLLEQPLISESITENEDGMFMWESTKNVLEYFADDEQAINQFLDEYHEWAAKGSFDENGESPLKRPNKSFLEDLPLGSIQLSYSDGARDDGIVARAYFNGYYATCVVGFESKY